VNYKSIGLKQALQVQT